jgi:protein XagA
MDDMRFTTTRLKYFIATVSLLAVMQQHVYADGFPVRPKTFLINPSISYFVATKAWDSTGVKHPFPQNGKFTAVTASLFAEYGLSRRWTLVALLPYTTNTYTQTGFSSVNSGFTDLETGIRYYLANIAYKDYIMLQGTVITPLYTNTNLGYGLTGVELKLSFAGSGHMFGLPSYFSLEDAVRQYFGTNGPIQDRYSGTYGLTLDNKFKNQISVTLGGIYSVSNFKKFILNNPNVDKNFAFNQVSLSYGHSFSREFSVFIGAGTFINGRNTGDGTNVSFGVVIKTF